MKRTTFILLTLVLCLATHAQVTRREALQLANDAVRQITMTGYMPSTEVMSQLASVADMSIDVISRMGDSNDPAQAKACIKLIDAIADFTQTPEGAPYADAMREGLKKAIDRSDDSVVRRHLLDGLVTCATAADVPHLVMYLDDAEMAPAAFRALVSMDGIDADLARVESMGAASDSLVALVVKARSGKAVAAPVTKAAPEVAATPFWTSSLDLLIGRMRQQPDASADSLIAANATASALPQLLNIARHRDGQARDAILARYITLLGQLRLNPAMRYLLLREADALNPCDDIRRKIIVDLGATRLVQALAYIRKYYDSRTMGDATAVAVADIVGNNAQANGGKHVYNMLNAAKYSLACHYGEEGAGTAIDRVLKAMEECRLDCGYNLATTSSTVMGKRGFWKMTEELADFDMTFDWQATGPLVVSLHSMPVLTVSRTQGARIEGDAAWHKFPTEGQWCTANVRVYGNKLCVTVNGEPIATDVSLVNPNASASANASGYVMFTADNDGAEVRQVCIKKVPRNCPTL
jgi:hypothetical protein